MAIGGDDVELDPARDTLVNVNAFGAPVPSARFMGGREFAMLVGDSRAAGATPTSRPCWRAAPCCCRRSSRVRTVSARQAAWIGDEPRKRGAQRSGLVLSRDDDGDCARTDRRATGRIIVEGPFAANAVFPKMLAAATGREVVAAGSATGTSVGAALLATGNDAGGVTAAEDVTITSPAGMWEAYAARWREAAA